MSIFYCLPVVEKCLEKRLAFTSADINFYNFLELHSKFSEKRFSFSNSVKPPSPELPKSARHDEKYLSSYAPIMNRAVVDSIATSPQSSQYFKQANKHS